VLVQVPQAGYDTPPSGETIPARLHDRLAHCELSWQGAPPGSIPGTSSQAALSKTSSSQLVAPLIWAVHCWILPAVHPVPVSVKLGQTSICLVKQVSTSPNWFRRLIGSHAATLLQKADMSC
jgi:hypothetical protein